MKIAAYILLSIFLTSYTERLDAQIVGNVPEKAVLSPIDSSAEALTAAAISEDKAKSNPFKVHTAHDTKRLENDNPKGTAAHLPVKKEKKSIPAGKSNAKLQKEKATVGRKDGIPTNDPTPTNPKEVVPKTRLYGIGALVIISFVFIILYRKAVRTARINYQRILEMEGQYQALIAANDATGKNGTNSNTHTELQSVVTVAKQERSETPLTGKHFIGEAFVTAGPRKNIGRQASESDFGLGEDVSGLLLTHEKAFFWVLDGTSDSDALNKPQITKGTRKEEYFSSRLLAQTIGWNLHQQIKDGFPEFLDATDVLRKALSDTELEWRRNLNELDAETRDDLNQSLRIKNGVLQCSTTAVFGILGLDGTLDICRIGDTKIVASPGHHQFGASTARQFATIQEKEGRAELVFSPFDNDRNQRIKLPEITTVAVMTDGISTQMERWLRGSNNLDLSSRALREVFTHFKQETYDDKALCMIQIKTFPAP